MNNDKSEHLHYSVVVPVYNSQKSLVRLNSELHEVMGKLGEPYELLYVDDCSPDGSWEVLKRLQAQNPEVRIIRLAGNVGQLTALICGVQNSRGQHIITIDDDLEYNTFDIEKLVEHYKANQFLIVYAIPKGKGQKNFSYRLFYVWRNLVLNYILGKRHTEGFRVFNRKVVANKEGMGSVSIHLEAIHKLLIDERFVGRVNVEYRKRPFGSSGHNVVKKMKIIAEVGIDYLRSPLKGYIYIGIFLILLIPFISWALLNVLWSSLLQILMILFIVFCAMALIAMGLLAKLATAINMRIKGGVDYIIYEQY